MYRISNKIFEQIKIEVLNQKFLDDYGLNYDIIENFIFGNEFYTHINTCVSEKDFNSYKVFAAFKNLILTLNKDSNINESNILEYIYNYSLEKSFPEAAQVFTTEENRGVMDLSLKLFHVIFKFEKECDCGNWQSTYALRLMDKNEYKKFDSSDEYKKFTAAFNDDYLYEMMKLNQDVIGYNTLDHICGVHHIAMSISRQLYLKDLEIDLGLVSGAAAGHDIGKFGTLPDEAHKVAYYHYYYSGEWFRKREIVYIRNIAINHSTWDLELENLTIESLLLIYCDFRVKQGLNGEMKFYSLEDSFEVILKKLDNVDEVKKNRYLRVYAKLKDFEEYLREYEINLSPDFDIEKDEIVVANRRYYSLVQGQEIVEGTKFMSISHNIQLMNMIKTENSLNKMLENARGIDNINSLRGYINIVQEYYTYLTQKQKLMVIKFLYERLITPEEDIRIESAQLIGEIIATFDEKIRKELPPRARVSSLEVSSDDLLYKYINGFLDPEQKIIEKHRVVISRNLKSMLKSYFNNIEEEAKLEKLQKVLDTIDPHCHKGHHMKCFLDIAKVLPIYMMTTDQTKYIIDRVLQITVNSDDEVRLIAWDTLSTLLPYIEESVKKEIDISSYYDKLEELDRTEAYAIVKNLEMIDPNNELIEQKNEFIFSDLESSSDLFLSNLKVGTKMISKKLQVEILLKYGIYNKETKGFYTAMHFSNMLKIVNNEEVRTAIGEGLTYLTSHLSFEEKTEIVVELLRALELENFQYTKYIPEYLGIMLVHIAPKELNEIIKDFKIKIKKSNRQVSTLILKTVGVFIINYPKYRYAFNESNDELMVRLKDLLSIIMNGYVSYEPQVNQMAISVLGKDIFGSKILSLKEKAFVFKIIGKKFLSLLVNNDENLELNFLNNAAGIKHIYRFLSDYLFYYGDLKIEINNRIAYFPGAFDPFSLSHKEIAKRIRDLGYEVYLAVDEFSWSKRTQPNLIRRAIIKMSVADEFGMFVFPRDLQVNIANEEDIKNLKDYFGNVTVNLVAGSDVVMNASAYRKEKKEHSIHSLNHVIFTRDESNDLGVQFKILEERVKEYGISVEYLTLPDKLQIISSTQIRTYIDENRDISELIDPLAQKFIYKKGLYLREPQFKEIMTTKSIDVEILDNIADDDLRELLDVLPKYKLNEFERISEYIKLNKARVLVVKKRLDENEIIGFAVFHWLRSSKIYNEFKDPLYEEAIRNNSVGRILMIDGIYANDQCLMRNVEQLLVTETLAYNLARDYTYAIYRDFIISRPHKNVEKVLILQGFVKLCSSKDSCIYHVNMSAPCTLSLDIRSMIKEPFSDNENVLKSIDRTREKLLMSLTKLYPGNLVLSFDRNMIYEHLIKKIVEENGMPTEPLQPRQLGEAMCVPFGEIFKKRILPNTVTKSLHTEKFMLPSAEDYEIEAYPYYLDLLNQVKMLKSFNRPIFLVDDLLNKGYRIKAVDPLLKAENIEIKKVFVGLMSGRGKSLMEMQNREVDSAYFIPRLKVWFNESKLYPFLGGDTLWRGQNPERNIIPSINLILPYASAGYIKGASKQSIYDMSRVAITNALNILKTLEDEYQKLHEKSLTMGSLPEVMVYPRYPDRGEMQKLDLSVKASDYLQYDLEHLERLKDICSKD
ncbi:MAG: cytidyltransferase [Clostridiales bacterium]|nr:cytidyltransferase [Clostridiales bacterium]